MCDRFPEVGREAFDSTIGASLLSGSGGFVGKGWTVQLGTVLSEGPGIDDVSWRRSAQDFHFA